MANILNSRAFFFLLFTILEAIESRSKSLWKQKPWMDCLNQENSNKLMKTISLSEYKRNILAILYIKLFRLKEIFQKLWLSCPGFYYCFCCYFYSYSISALHSILKFFKVSFFASLSYKYMKI